MTMTAPERLRPMSDAERTAATMFDAAREAGDPLDKAMATITNVTGLSRAQVAAAVELKNKFGALLSDTGQPPSPVAKSNGTRVVTTPVAMPPVAEAEPATPSAPTTAPNGPLQGIEDLLAAAERSPQQRARDLAAEVRRAVEALRQLIGNDEKVRVLTASVEVLRAQLAKDEAELAKLLGPTTPPASPPAVAAQPEPVPGLRDSSTADEPKRKLTRQECGRMGQANRDPLAYSENVRAWARNTGRAVGVSGRIAGWIITDYRAAHPEA